MLNEAKKETERAKFLNEHHTLRVENRNIGVLFTYILLGPEAKSQSQCACVELIDHFQGTPFS